MAIFVPCPSILRNTDYRYQTRASNITQAHGMIEESVLDFWHSYFKSISSEGAGDRVALIKLHGVDVVNCCDSPPRIAGRPNIYRISSRQVARRITTKIPATGHRPSSVDFAILPCHLFTRHPDSPMTKVRQPGITVAYFNFDEVLRPPVACRRHRQRGRSQGNTCQSIWMGGWNMNLAYNSPPQGRVSLLIPL